MASPSNTNNGIMAALSKHSSFPVSLLDNLFIGSGQTAQATAQVVLRSGANRITSSVSSGACLLPSMANLDEGNALIFVINDSANAVAVFCDPGETMNGSSNGSLSIASGGFGVFMFRPDNSMLPQQSILAHAAADWRAAAFT